MRSLLLLFLVSGCATCVALTKGGSTLKKAVVRGRQVAHVDTATSDSAFDEWLKILALKVPQLCDNPDPPRVAVPCEKIKHPAAIGMLLKDEYQAVFDEIKAAMFGGEGLVAATKQETGSLMYEVKFTTKTVDPMNNGKNEKNQPNPYDPSKPTTDHGPGWYFFEEFKPTADAAEHKVNWDAYSTKTDKKYRFTKPQVSWGVEGTQLFDCGGPTEIDGVKGKVKACWFTAAALKDDQSTAWTN